MVSNFLGERFALRPTVIFFHSSGSNRIFRRFQGFGVGLTLSAAVSRVRRQRPASNDAGMGSIHELVTIPDSFS